MVGHQYTINFIYIADLDLLGHNLMSMLQYLPGLSPGVPWPAAAYALLCMAMEFCKEASILQQTYHKMSVCVV